MDLTIIQTVLKELPYIGIIVWLVLVLQDKITAGQREVIDRFTQSMEKRDVAYITMLNKMNENFATHDTEMKSALAVMYDRAEREKEGK